MAHLIDPAKWTSYARSPAKYQKSRYRSDDLTYATVGNFVSAAEQSKMIEHKKSRSGQRGWQSRMRLSDIGFAALSNCATKLIYDPSEIIVLRDADGNLAEYPDTDDIRRMRANLHTINEALTGTDLMYDGRVLSPGDVVADGDSRFPVRKALYRVHNRSSFNCNGRFFGDFWQNIQKEKRREIIINGRRCVECDFSQLHPRLLYALVGQKLQGDAYEIDGWERGLVKRATNTLINAETELAAKRSIAGELSRRKRRKRRTKTLISARPSMLGGPGIYARIQALIEAIKAKHAVIADGFGSDAGIYLMIIDSAMAEAVMLKLIARGICSLPVHDSFLVEQQHAGVLEEVMDEVLNLTLRRIGGNVRTIVSLSKNIPQYGDDLSVCLCPPIVVQSDNQPIPGNNNHDSDRLDELKSEAA